MTLRDILLKTVTRSGKNIALRWKEGDDWHTATYPDMLLRVRKVSAALAALKVKPGDRVGLLRENHPEWVSDYFGIVCMGATAVPMDAKLREREVAYILRDANPKVLITEAKFYPLLREAEALGTGELRHVLVKGGAPANTEKLLWADLDEVLGKADPLSPAFDAHPPTAEDVASILYTSGTTGWQKGVMLTHGNFVANAEGCSRLADFRSSDNVFVVLPLHHAFAFMGGLILPVFNGCEISFAQSLRTVGENIRETCPTVFFGVPLMLEKIYHRIRQQLDNSGLAKVLLCLGLRGPILRKVRESMGGRLRLIITGGAPCNPAILQALEKLGLFAIEGYGLTETSPVLTVNPPNAPRHGTVGRALDNVDIRIHEPNESGEGEILARGPSVMKGYYKNTDATSEVLKDGWLHTGDLGRMDADGYLSITGRLKSLIVNREGKNIHPGEVEAALNQSPFILESLVLGYREPGEKIGERVGVIIVPRAEAFEALRKREDTPVTREEALVLIREEIRKYSSQLAEYKRPRRIEIRSEEFEKTSTGKIKRYLYRMEALTLDEEG